MFDPITRLAPAKLNLFLHINGQRQDGYHLLQSVFVPINWCDELEFFITQDGAITREDAAHTTEHTDLPMHDLSVRAAQALQAQTSTAMGVHIRLKKHIPPQAGLGGGSSDAATTLLALNELWQLNLPLHELKRIGLSLGADVPFFLHQAPAWVEGIGEKILPFKLPTSLKRKQFLIVKPPIGVSTAAIFSSPKLSRNTKTVTIDSFAAWAQSNADQQYLELFGCNDLQPIALEVCPAIAHALRWLEDLGLKGRMTGSGSAVFALVPDSFNLTTAPHLPEGWICKLCRLI